MSDEKNKVTAFWDDSEGYSPISARRAVTTRFYNELLSQATANIPKFSRDAALQSKDVVGRAYWKSLDDNWVRRVAGEVVAHMVANRLVPLTFIHCRHCTIKRYRRI